MNGEVKTELRVPCDHPGVIGWVSIEEIMSQESAEFHGGHNDYDTEDCPEDHYGTPWCDERMDGKREDPSYTHLIVDLKAGKGFKNPVMWIYNLSNGHHRVIAALDCGFTHVPFSDTWGEEDDDY